MEIFFNNHLATPSDYAKDWHQSLSSEGAPVCFRGDGKFQIPLSLHFPLFGEFVCDQSDRNLYITKEDERFAHQLIASMSSHHHSEADRVSEFRKLLSNYLRCDFTSENNEAELTGTCLSLTKKIGDAEVLLLNVEVKQLNSSKGDPTMQNIADYARFWVSDRQIAFRNACPCPTFFIELIDNYLIFSGCVFTNRIHCEPLAMVPIVSIVSQKRRFFTPVINLFASLKLKLVQLEQFYWSSFKSIQSKSVASYVNSFPYVLQFECDGSLYSFEYQERLGTQKLIFKITIVRVDSSNSTHSTERLKVGQHLICKFTETYSEEAHQLLAKHKLAPALYAVEPVSGSWKMVVMEDLCCFRSIGQCDQIPDNEKRMHELQRAVNLLHKKGYVHGDLRPPNIMISEKDPAQLRIIDFDWAGKENQVFYPDFLNPKIEWPDGVERRKPILKQHDLAFLESFVRNNIIKKQKSTKQDEEEDEEEVEEVEEDEDQL